MTSIIIIREIGCWELCDFPTSTDPHSHGSLDKSKNPYPSRNYIISNSATTRAPGTTWAVVSWFHASMVAAMGIMISQLEWVPVIGYDKYIKYMH